MTHPYARQWSRRRVLNLALAWAGAAGVLPALAQQPAPQSSTAKAWTPKGSMRIIVPFAAGGTSDMVARLLATHLGQALGQSVIVENRAGAGGNIGIAAVARAVPDGHTLLLASSSFVTNPALYPDKRPYDPTKQFAPISLVVTSPDVIVVPADSPISTLSDLFASAKTKEGGLNYSTPGKGNSVHLGGGVAVAASQGEPDAYPVLGVRSRGTGCVGEAGGLLARGATGCQSADRGGQVASIDRGQPAALA